MRTGLVESWGGNPLDMGPIYPFVGAEGLLFVVCVVLWIVYMVWQMRFECSSYREEMETLGQDDNLIQTVRNNQKNL